MRQHQTELSLGAGASPQIRWKVGPDSSLNGETDARDLGRKDYAVKVNPNHQVHLPLLLLSLWGNTREITVPTKSAARQPGIPPE